jgi:hypothetical protein
VKLLAIDMDGTLLNSSSEISARTVEALRVALDSGVRVVLATGKARPAAMAALSRVGLAGAASCSPMYSIVCPPYYATCGEPKLPYGLQTARLWLCFVGSGAGEGLVVSDSQPGVFLQGLAVYGSSGELLKSAELPRMMLPSSPC